MRDQAAGAGFGNRECFLLFGQQATDQYFEWFICLVIHRWHYKHKSEICN
jgi:hypothetical protein